jgi:hypothetical protein
MGTKKVGALSSPQKRTNINYIYKIEIVKKNFKIFYFFLGPKQESYHENGRTIFFLIFP